MLSASTFTALLLLASNLYASASVLPRNPDASEIHSFEPIIIPKDVNGQLDVAAIDAILLDITIGAAAKKATCPATNNGANRNYAQRAYTENQVKAAMLTGAKLGAADKTVGANSYPHLFSNVEDIPFTCGKNKQEFPILLDNSVYTGGAVDAIPDRVVWEARSTKKAYQIYFCGVMRHGPARPFLLCP